MSVPIGAGAPSPDYAPQDDFAGLSVLADLDHRPLRILASFPGPAPDDRLWPRRVGGSLSEDLAAVPGRRAHLLSLHRASGERIHLFLLSPGPVAFGDRLDPATGELSGGLVRAADRRLLHVPSGAGARWLALASARRVGEGEGGVVLDAERIYDLRPELEGDPPAALPIAPGLVLPVGEDPEPLPGSPTPEIEARVTRIRGTRDPGEAFDIVVIGDGFTAAELPDLRRHVADLADRLLGVAEDPMGFPGIPPFCETGIRELVSIHLIEIASPESGISCCPDLKQERVTALGFRGDFHGTGSEIDFDTDQPTKVDELIERLVGTSSEVEVRLVLVNCSRWGGRGFRDRKMAIVPLFKPGDTLTNLAVHEMAHAAADLGDEYLSCSIEQDVLVDFQNVATPSDLAAGPVSWLGDADEDEMDPASGQLRVRHEWGRPEPEGEDAYALGLFWGAQFVGAAILPAACSTKPPDPAFGAYYRPMRTCKMRRTSVDFCRVCRRVLRDAIRSAARV